MGNPATFQIRLRLRQELRQRLEIESQKRGISKAEALVERLEKSFAAPDPLVHLSRDMKRLLAMQSGKVDA